MKRILLSVFALGAMTSIALANPTTLSGPQAGQAPAPSVIKSATVFGNGGDLIDVDLGKCNVLVLSNCH